MSEVASASAVGPPPGMRVRLSSNESAWGPAPGVSAAVAAVADRVHLYPDDQSTDLRAALAAHEGVAPAQVSVGNGSANILMDLLAIEHRRGGGAVVAYERAFVVYRLGAQAVGAAYREAPLGDRFARDPDALLGLVDDATAAVCLDNPGNPTGRHLRGDELRAIVEAVPEDVTIIVDEAYHHFAAGQDGYATAAELELDHPRLVVLRTFSKAHALAGLRVGYATAAEDVIAPLEAGRARFNLNAAAQAAALAALADRDHLDRAVAGTLAGRARMASGLRDLGVDPIPSLGNFLTLPLDRPAGPVVEAYAAEGVGVRPLLPYGLDRHLRVTVGTPDEVEDFLAASATVLTDAGPDAGR